MTCSDLRNLLHKTQLFREFSILLRVTQSIWTSLACFFVVIQSPVCTYNFFGPWFDFFGQSYKGIKILQRYCRFSSAVSTRTSEATNQAWKLPAKSFSCSCWTWSSSSFCLYENNKDMKLPFSVNRLGDFWTLLATIFLAKVAQIFDIFLGYWKKQIF